jgi:hypothetical protein
VTGTATTACGGAAAETTPGHAALATPEAPIVAAQPGAWFDAEGNLTVVGSGRRLHLVLSAPIAACSSAFEGPGTSTEIAARASLPFHVLSEVCRETHPTILLPAESDTASPAELERSYHEVAHCAAFELGVSDGWIPRLVAESDPCPSALGAGWRLPRSAELEALTTDDRKAIAGAVFDTESRSVFGSLLIYARSKASGVELATLSPNTGERAPELDAEKRARPFGAAALRCVRDPNSSARAEAPPPLPEAAKCLRAEREAQGLLTSKQPKAPVPAELEKLKVWTELAQRTPALLNDPANIHGLTELLDAPAIERLAREAREERALTEHYAELADSLDDPAASEGERERRRREFDALRRRLGGKIVQSTEAASSARTQLWAVTTELQALLERRKQAMKTIKKSRAVDYGPALKRLGELRGGKTSAE